MQIIWLERADYVAYITAEGWLRPEGGIGAEPNIGLGSPGPCCYVVAGAHLWTWDHISLVSKFLLRLSPRILCLLVVCLVVCQDSQQGWRRRKIFCRGDQIMSSIHIMIELGDIEIHLRWRKHINIPYWSRSFSANVRYIYIYMVYIFLSWTKQN